MQRLERDTSGRRTSPWTTSRCWSGSMSGIPEWLRSKCRPLGVIIPSSRCSGVRAVPTPGSGGFGGERTARTTLSSKCEGWPYGAKPAPGSFIQLCIARGSADALDAPAHAALVTSAPSRKIRRLRIPLPAAGSLCLLRDGARRERPLVIYSPLYVCVGISPRVRRPERQPRSENIFRSSGVSVT
jgi:hypothetical protein